MYDYTKFNVIKDTVLVGIEVENLLQENNPIINTIPAQEFLDYLYDLVRLVFDSSEQTITEEKQ